MEECAEAAIQVLDAAVVERAAILGLSWGGFVALRLALAAPQRVSALVLSNTSARSSTFLERQRGRLVVGLVRIGVPVGRVIGAKMLSIHSRAHNKAFATQFVNGANNLDSAGLARAARSVDVNSTSVVDDLGCIAAPTLVIAGAEDHIFPRTHSEELAERIPGARLEVVSNVSHLAPAEAPVAVAALLRGFLADKRNDSHPPPIEAPSGVGS